jgi:hypothetical protein
LRAEEHIRLLSPIARKPSSRCGLALAMARILRAQAELAAAGQRDDDVAGTLLCPAACDKVAAKEKRP